MDSSNITKIGKNSKIPWSPGLFSHSMMNSPEIGKLFNDFFEKPDILKDDEAGPSRYENAFSNENVKRVKMEENDDDKKEEEDDDINNRSNVNWNQDVLIIAIDGYDGAGKSRLIEFLYENGKGIKGNDIHASILFQTDGINRWEEFPVRRLTSDFLSHCESGTINLLETDNTYSKQYGIYDDVSSKMELSIKFLNMIHKKLDDQNHIPVLIVERGLSGIQFITEFYRETGEFSDIENDSLVYQRNQCFIPADKTILLKVPKNEEEDDEFYNLHEHYNDNGDDPYIKQCVQIEYNPHEEETVKFCRIQKELEEAILKFKKNRDKRLSKKRSKRAPKRRTIITRSMTSDYLNVVRWELKYGKTGSLSRI